MLIELATCRSSLSASISREQMHSEILSGMLMLYSCTVQQNLKRANLMNDKLQELCRTLQKQSREVLEESKQRAQHEAEQRKTLSDKMEATVKV